MISPLRPSAVEAAWRAPSVYDETLRLMARQGLAVPASHLDRDWTQPYTASDAVERAWLVVYRDPAAHWALYQLGEKLVDLPIMEEIVRRHERGVRVKVIALHARSLHLAYALEAHAAAADVDHLGAKGNFARSGGAVHRIAAEHAGAVAHLVAGGLIDADKRLDTVDETLEHISP